MLTNKVITLAVLAALSGQTLAGSAHRQAHRAEAAKRAGSTEWVTVLQTVVVTAGVQPEPTAVAVPVPVVEQPQPVAPVVEQPQPEAPVAVEAPAVIPAPATTLSTAVKPDPSVTPNLASTSVLRNKRGIAYNSAAMADTFARACPKCAWSYNWEAARKGLSQNTQYIPMLWGPRPPMAGWFDDHINDALNAGAKAILSFNEPDHHEQSNVSPAEAAREHTNRLNKFSPRVQIGSPAVTNSGEPGMGLEWLQSFMNECKTTGCKIDFCAVHWYSGYQWRNTLFEYLEKAHRICDNKPIWLTEFAPTGSDVEKEQFMREVIPRLDNLSYLHAYSYFWVDSTSLMKNANELSSYGSIYATI